MSKIVNMTPHAIVLETVTSVATYEPSGSVVRLDMTSKTIGQVDGFDIVSSTVSGHNLPDPVEGTFILVSAMVLGAFPSRTDLVAPNTGEAKRNEKGHIISVPGFISNAS